jgi:hypothetical protein
MRSVYTPRCASKYQCSVTLGTYSDGRSSLRFPVRTSSMSSDQLTTSKQQFSAALPVPSSRLSPCRRLRALPRPLFTGSPLMHRSASSLRGLIFSVPASFVMRQCRGFTNLDGTSTLLIIIIFVGSRVSGWWI